MGVLARLFSRFGQAMAHFQPPHMRQAPDGTLYSIFDGRDALRPEHV